MSSVRFFEMIVLATEIHRSIPTFCSTFVTVSKAPATATIARASEMGCIAPELSSTTPVFLRKLANKFVACAAKRLLVRSGYVCDSSAVVITPEDSDSYTCH